MPNKVYTNTETKIIFVDPTVGSGADFVSFLPAGLANGSGYLSDPRDMSDFPHATLFRWRGKTKCDTAPTLNSSVELYWMGFDDPAELTAATGLLFGPDANLGSGNQALGDPNRKKNLQWLGAITVDRAQSGVPFTNSGLCHLFGRYGSVVCWNQSGGKLSTAADATAFSLTPAPDEIE
jgi:hypothetical protein